MDAVLLQNLIMFLIRLIVIGMLTYGVIKNKQQSLKIFLLALSSMLISYIFAIMQLFGYFFVFAGLYSILIIHGANITFYAGNNRNAKYFMLITAILCIPMSFYGFKMHGLSIADRQYFSDMTYLFMGPTSIIAFSFFTVSMWQAYNNIKDNEIVEPWLKKRYQFLIIFGIFMIMTGFVIIFARRDESLNVNWAYNVMFILNYLTILFEALAWIMPTPLKKFFNRNWKQTTEIENSEVENMSEEDLMEAWN